MLEWNSPDLWVGNYGDEKPRGLCFSQDVFGGQFTLSDAVYHFEPETGDEKFIANDIEEWATALLRDYDILTGHSIAHDWQAKNGPIPLRHRLVPLTPFVLGGKYDLGNLVAMEAAKAMRIRARLAIQLRNLPDGSRISYEIEP